MRSFALWYSSEQSESEEESKDVTVHINLWDKRQSSDKKYLEYYWRILEV